MNCKRLWLAAASAFAFVLNALLFCRKHPSKKKDSNGSLDPGQGSSSSGSEKQQLLANDRLPEGEGRKFAEETGSNPLFSGPASHQERFFSPLVKDRTAKGAKDQQGSLATKRERAGSKVQQQGEVHEQAASATDTSTRHSKMKQPLSPGAQLNKSKKAKLQHQQGEQGAQALQHQQQGAVDASKIADGTLLKQQQEQHMQSLLEEELGAPKFSVPKTLHSAKDSMGSLKALLDQEFGPPKFAVPKASAQGHQSKQGPKQDQKEPVSDAQPAPAAQRKASVGGAQPHAADEAPVQPPASKEQQRPHLRLEVLSGPATGRVLDTRDPGQELRIGRFPDSSLSLSEDPEVSGKHAVIAFSSAEQRWKLHDAGSLNGTSLNGVAISTYNRLPGSVHALADGDIVEVGSVTQIKVTCEPSPASTAPADPNSGGLPKESQAQEVQGVTEAGVHGIANTAGNGGAPQGPGPSPRNGVLRSFVATDLGPHLDKQEYPELGLQVAVHQRTGVDHKRNNTGCEDVITWQVPFAWKPGNAMLALFDGHQGVKAADAAKQLIPKLLQEKTATASTLVPQAPGSEQQGEMLRSLFLEADQQLSSDEGCTATLVLLSREDGQPASPSTNASKEAGGNSKGGALRLQTANVGDSSAVLIRLPKELSHEEEGQGATGAGGAGVSASTSNASHSQGGSSSHSTHQHHPAAVLFPPQTAGDDAVMELPSAQGHSAAAGGQQGPGTSAGGAAKAGKHGGVARLLSAGGRADAGGSVRGTEWGGTQWIRMTADHRIASSSAERERLRERGHATIQTRLYGLNISRMLGDKFLKDENLGFLAEPFVSEVEVIQPGSPPAFLVLASDGLWDVVKESRVAAVIAKEYAVEPGVSAARIADVLLSQALALRSKDDITVFVARINV